MSFTDDDLKRLKEDWFGLTDSGSMLTNVGKLKALLARLDAESWCAELLRVHYEAGVFDDLDQEDLAIIVQALDKQRKAAGK